jgi:peptidoglycan/LPS O-acetylase OafA/YrhL
VSAIDSASSGAVGLRADLAAAPSIPRYGRYRAFGAFRFLLALIVVVEHFHYLLAEEQRWPFRRWGFGIIAVDVFFMISGFVIAEANAETYAGRPGQFMVNRLLRVVPPYWAALAASVAVHALLWRAGTLALWDFTLKATPVSVSSVVAGALDILPLGQGASREKAFEFIPFAWSLRVELLFYAVAFAACALASRPPGGVPDARWRAMVGAGVIAASGLAFVAFLAGRAPAIFGDVPFFVCGAALYFACSRRAPWAQLLAVAAAAGSIAALFRLRMPGRAWVASEQAVILVALGIAFVALALVPRVGAAFRRFDRSAGDLSYPLYLNHYVVGILFYDLTPTRNVGVFLVATAASVVFAWAMMRVVETPLRGVRSRIRGTRL